jgi:DNA-binding transcriptional MerR regulator
VYNSNQKDFSERECHGQGIKRQSAKFRPLRARSTPSTAIAEPAETHLITIGELARKSGISLRALRFYQSKGLLAPQRNGNARVFTNEDRDCLELILQGKRLGFTLGEIHEMMAARPGGCDKSLPISRKRCVDQIRFLENQHRELEVALRELRRIYSGMFGDTGERLASESC